MRNKFILFLILGCVAHAQVQPSSQITDLLNEYLLVNTQLRSIYQKIAVGQVVSQINTEQLAKFDEIITEKYRESTSQSSRSIAILGWSSSNSGSNYSQSSGYNKSKIIASNPREAAHFSLEEQRDFGKMQSGLQVYINKNEDAIIQMLLLGARASYLAYQLEQQGLSISETEITDTVEMTSNIYFLGVQNVSRCVQINFAGSTDSTRTSANSSYAANVGFWASVASSSSYSHSTSLERISHSVTNCSAGQNWAKIDSSRSTQTVTVQFLSSVMREWVGALSRSRVISKQVPTLNLNWNSPFFK